MGETIEIKDFLKLSKEEKVKRYVDMSDQDKFLWRTQYEIPFGQVTGHFEVTEEQEKRAREALHQHLRNRGVLKED